MMNGESYIIAFAFINSITALVLVLLGFRCMHRTRIESELRPVLLGIVAATGFFFMQLDYIIAVSTQAKMSFFREVVQQLVILMTHSAIGLFMLRHAFSPVVKECNCKGDECD